mgnify:CR=1 FL=1
MRPFLLTSLLLLFTASAFGQSDTSAYRDLSDIVVEAASVYEVLDTTDNEPQAASVRGLSTVVYRQGYFMSLDDQPTDSLTLLMNNKAESEIWRSNSWEWTVRENSAIGGIQYDALDPYLTPELDGWHQFSRSYLAMPNYHSATSPKTDLTVLTGIGGGQLFGLKTMSPVDSAKQLWVDYLRSNALGLYRNEGTDGHELNIKMRQDGVYNEGKRTLPLHGFEFSFFNARSGQHGGLISPDFFEINVPTLRRNFSVANNRGELYEESLHFMYYHHLKDITLKAQLKSAVWAIQNDLQQTEYFWDSTTVVPELDSRTLYYSDSLRLTSAEVVLHHDKILGELAATRAYYALQTHVGLENLVSNSGGWDAFRTDSSTVTESFNNTLQPFVRAKGTLALHRQNVFSFRGTYAIHLLGFNARGYDLRNKVSIPKFPGDFSVSLNLLHQPKMYRFEQLYGYSYDFRDIEVSYFKNEARLDWKQGELWKKELLLYGAQITGIRYLESFDELAAWDGTYTRAQVGLMSDRQGLNLSVQGYGAYKSSFGGFATPNWGGFTEANYKMSIGTKFELKVGINVSIEDAFYTPTYLVGVPIWAMQTDHLAGSYPWVTALFEARIANFIAGVRVVNALEGLTDYNYYAFGATPRTDRWVQLSARWTLFN